MDFNYFQIFKITIDQIIENYIKYLLIDLKIIIFILY